MTSVPAFVEILPDRWEPIEECSRDDIAAASLRLMGSAVMLAREAVEDAEHFGWTSSNGEMMERAKRDHAEAHALEAYLNAPEDHPEE